MKKLFTAIALCCCFSMIYGQGPEMRYITSMASFAVKNPGTQGEPKDTMGGDYFVLGSQAVFLNFKLSKPVKNILDELKILPEEAGMILLMPGNGSNSNNVSIALDKSNFDKENIAEVTKVKIKIYKPGDPSTFMYAPMADQYLSRNYAEPDEFISFSPLYLIITKKGKPVNGIIGYVSQGFKCEVASQKEAFAKYTKTGDYKKISFKEIKTLYPQVATYTIDQLDKIGFYQFEGKYTEKNASETYTLTGKNITKISATVMDGNNISYSKGAKLDVAIEAEGGVTFKVGDKSKESNCIDWSELVVTAKNCTFDKGKILPLDIAPIEVLKNNKAQVSIALKSKPEIKADYNFNFVFTGVTFIEFKGDNGSDGEEGESASDPARKGGDGGKGGDGLAGPDVYISMDLYIEPVSKKEYLKVKIEVPSQKFVKKIIMDPADSRISLRNSGGKGGKGGDGGKGGSHDTCNKLYYSGDGGNGGSGGNGAAAGKLYITYSPAAKKYSEKRVEFLSFAGMGGSAGTGGSYGESRTYNMNCPVPKPGVKGKDGQDGREYSIEAANVPVVKTGPVIVD
jgi:hypothetical protein